MIVIDIALIVLGFGAFYIGWHIGCAENNAEIRKLNKEIDAYIVASKARYEFINKTTGAKNV
jgi:hypothetical protein